MSSFATSGRCAGSAMNGAADALIGAASADVAVHGAIDFGVRGFWRLRQQCRRGHDLSGLTVAALRNLFCNPGRLQRMIRCTVQAPHCCRPHPNLVPVSPTASRMTQRRGVSGATSTLYCLPLTVREIISAPPACEFIALDYFGEIGKSKNSKSNDS